MSNKTGYQLRKLRKEHGLSQEKFAQEIGVSRQIISRWEKGSVTPNANSIKKICEFYKINSDLFLNIENPTGDLNSHPVAKIRLKTVLKGVACFLLLLFIIYIVYSIYKFLLLKDLEEKFKEYDNWTNYYAEIRTFEEAKLVGKTEIWYKDNKYKMVITNYFENGEIVENTKWVDCETNMTVEYNQQENSYTEYETVQNSSSYRNGAYIKKFFYWINLVQEDCIKTLVIQPNVIFRKTTEDQKNIVLGRRKIKMDKNSYIPQIYEDNTSDKLIIKCYDIKLNEVENKDVDIKKKEMEDN